MKRLWSWTVLFWVLVVVAGFRWVGVGGTVSGFLQLGVMVYLLWAAAPRVAYDVSRLLGLWARVPKRRRSLSGNGANTL